MSIVFGIHVGNTSACLALHKDGKEKVIANDAGDRITPAVVTVTGNEKIVGTSAKAGIARNNTSTVVQNKRLLNNNLDDATFSHICNKVPYMVTREDGNLKYSLKNGESTFNVTAETIAVSIFSKLFDIASTSANYDSDIRAVLCCPTNFPQSSRRILMCAAEEAGFEVLQVISEPSAIALAYSIGVQNPDEDHLCLVYRVGGATMDVSILEEHCGMYTIHHTVHLSDLGGDKLTAVLAEYLAEEYRKKCKLDPSESRRSMTKLISAAESTKHVLSTLGTAHCFIESLCEGVDLSCNISRARFENMITPIIQQYMEPVEEALKKAKMEPKCVQKVLLSGGCVKIPKLQHVLREKFPCAEFVNHLSPDEVIAIGAAKHGSYLPAAVDPECQHLWREIPAVAVPIYIRGVGIEGMECIIHGMTPVPVKKLKRFSVKSEDDITFEILELHSQIPRREGILGKLTLGKAENNLVVNVEVNINSVGGLSAVLSDSSGHKKSTFKIEPPQE